MVRVIYYALTNSCNMHATVHMHIYGFDVADRLSDRLDPK